MNRILYLLLIGYAVSSCKNEANDIGKKKLYDGPIKVFEHIKALRSDSAKVIMQLTAARHEMYETGDEIFPKGVFMELFNEQKEVSTTISADEAYILAETDQVKLVGTIVIKSMESGDELNTELLFVEQKDGSIHTDSFVTIKSDGEVHTGEGLTSNIDFSKYVILKPAGTITIEEGLMQE